MPAPGARSPAAEPPPELVARFKESLDRLWPEGGRLGLAVSGGPDSLAMLLLAEAAIPGQFEVATVDHGLRPEAAQECAMVAEVCAARGIPCEVLKIEVERGNVQAKARFARYKALKEWARRHHIEDIATAHHADDQAETLLMRLNRGSGLAGLAGILEVSDLDDGVAVIRPLLRFRRSELAEAVASVGIAAADDPSNLDDRYDRARIRKALAGNDWLDPLAFVQSASNLADAEDALLWCSGQEWRQQVAVAEGELRYRGKIAPHGMTRAVPREITLRIVKRAIAKFGGEPRGQDIARLLDRLLAGESGNVAGVLATVEGDEWVFRPEPPRRSS